MRRENVIFSKEDTLILKGIAIGMMLFHHLFGFPERLPFEMLDIPWGGGLSYLLASFFKLCVMIYVFLGGYGIYHTFSRCKSMRETIRCLIGKIKKLYINYWKVFLIFVPLLYIFNYYVVDLGTFLKGFVGISHTYNSEWWFFFPYVVVVCLYAVGFKIFSIKGRWILIELIFICVWGYCWESLKLILESSIDFTIISIIISGLNFMPTFLCGAFFAKYDLLSKIKNILKKIQYSYLITVLGLFALIWIRYNVGDGYDWIMAIAFIIVILPITLMRENNPLSKILVRLGKESMTMWLIHTFFCYQFFKNEIYFTRIPILIFFVLLIISYVSSVLIRKLWEEINKSVEKFRPKLRKII